MWQDLLTGFSIYLIIRRTVQESCAIQVKFGEPHRHRAHQPEHRFQERALARAVGAHDRDELALGQREVDVPEHGSSRN